MANTTRGKLFYAEAVKGYNIKVMIDGLALNMPRTIFFATKKGLSHRNTDEAKHVLIDINFPRDNFKAYKCKRDIIFSVNLKHLQKMIRNVKKKDSLSMYITEKEPDTFYVAIRPSGASAGHNLRTETIHVQITRISDLKKTIELPEIHREFPDDPGVEVYNYPMVIDSNDFQKMKKMSNSIKIVRVQIQKNNYLCFDAGQSVVYGTKIECGELQDLDDDSSSSDDDMLTDEDEDDGAASSSGNRRRRGWFESEYHMKIFTLLMKFPGLCNQMQIYSPRIDGYPLKIRIQAGQLGIILIYIKDIKQIAIQESKRREMAMRKNDL